MSEAAASYLASVGIEVGDGFEHFGTKGMKWGVRKDRSSGGSGSGKTWTDDQKKKLKTVATVAGVAAIAAGVYFGTKAIQANGAKSVSSAAGAAKKVADGKKFAEAALKAKGSTRVGTMDPALRKFINDGPSRILADQKEWSKFLGKSLDSIQKEDLAFINSQIANMKALGA